MTSPTLKQSTSSQVSPRASSFQGTHTVGRCQFGRFGNHVPRRAASANSRPETYSVPTPTTNKAACNKKRGRQKLRDGAGRDVGCPKWPRADLVGAATASLLGPLKLAKSTRGGCEESTSVDVALFRNTRARSVAETRLHYRERAATEQPDVHTLNSFREELDKSKKNHDGRVTGPDGSGMAPSEL